MKTSSKIKYFAASMLLVSLVLIAGKVYSQSLEVSGNASGSNNSININQTQSSTVNQSNSSDVNNNVNATSDTGGNSTNDNVGGSSVTTGDATSKVKIDNQLNKNVIKATLTPTPKPSPKASPTSPIGAPTVTANPAPSGDGKEEGVEEDGGPGAAGNGQAPAVLGLAAASSDKSLFHLLPGVLSIAFGLNLLLRRAKT